MAAPRNSAAAERKPAPPQSQLTHAQTGVRRSCTGAEELVRSRKAAETRKEASLPALTRESRTCKEVEDRDCCADICRRLKSRCGTPIPPAPAPPGIQRQSWQFPRAARSRSTVQIRDPF